MLFIFIHYPQSKFPYPPLNIQKNCGKPTFFQVDDVPNRKPGVFHGFPHLSVCYPSVFSLTCSMDGSQQAGTIYWTDPCPPCPTGTSSVSEWFSADLFMLYHVISPSSITLPQFNLLPSGNLTICY